MFRRMFATGAAQGSRQWRKRARKPNEPETSAEINELAIRARLLAR
jgi:hypothetical protein